MFRLVFPQCLAIVVLNATLLMAVRSCAIRRAEIMVRLSKCSLYSTEVHSTFIQRQLCLLKRACKVCSCMQFSAWGRNTPPMHHLFRDCTRVAPPLKASPQDVEQDHRVRRESVI